MKYHPPGLVTLVRRPKHGGHLEPLLIIIIGMTALYGPLPSLDFLTTGFLQAGAVNPTPNPQPGGPGLRICDRATQLYPQALGTHFSRILRHA
jgi:hypothetical protein